MPQGTNDFIDQAVAVLQAGGHPFVLVALHDRDARGERVYAMRSGYLEERDVAALQDIVRNQLPAYLEHGREAEE